MTVGYMKIAATAKLSTFLRLLIRWRGSVWKGVWRELFMWLFAYNWITIIYRLYLRDTEYGMYFERMVTTTDAMILHARTGMIFVLGFYVQHIASRWWSLFMAIPWPDTIALSIAAFLHTRKGKEKEDRITRVTIMRYIVLSYVLIFRDISERIRLRFPTLEHLVPGLLTEHELRMLKANTNEFYHVFQQPIQWALTLLKECRERRQISDVHYVYLTKQILKFSDGLLNIRSFDLINVPLVYTQVVMLYTQIYFFICLFARQYIAIEDTDDIRWKVDYFLPFFTIIEFICLMGWLKSAQVMINPFGQDDDDFEVDTLIERNLAVSMSMVDNFYDRAPPLAYMGDVIPQFKKSNRYNPMVGSAVPIKIQETDMKRVDDEQAKWLTNATDKLLINGVPEGGEREMEEGSNNKLDETQPLLNSNNNSKHDSTKSVESYKKLLPDQPFTSESKTDDPSSLSQIKKANTDVPIEKQTLEQFKTELKDKIQAIEAMEAQLVDKTQSANATPAGSIRPEVQKPDVTLKQIRGMNDVGADLTQGSMSANISSPVVQPTPAETAQNTPHESTLLPVEKTPLMTAQNSTKNSLRNPTGNKESQEDFARNYGKLINLLNKMNGKTPENQDSKKKKVYYRRTRSVGSKLESGRTKNRDKNEAKLALKGKLEYSSKRKAKPKTDIKVPCNIEATKEKPEPLNLISKEADKVEVKATEANKFEAQSTKVARAEAKPKEAPKIEVKNTEAPKATTKSNEALKTETISKEAPKVETKSTEATKAEANSKEASKVETKDISKIDATEKVESKSEVNDNLKVDTTPGSNSIRKKE